MSEKKTSIRAALDADVEAVVAVHLSAFPKFFLSTLGPRFLRTMYEAFLVSRDGIFIVAEQQGVVRGFAVGAMKSAGKDREIARQLMFRFILASLPAIFRSPLRVGKRLLTRLWNGGDEYDVPDRSAVLRSIGVVPEMRGRELAYELLNEFELRAHAMGAKVIALTTDANENERAVRFYKRNLYNVSRTFVSAEGRAMLLMVKSLAEASEAEGD